MKYATFLIAGFALAGCDITLGGNGVVMTQSDSVLSQVAPMGNRTQSAPAQTAMDGVQPTTPPSSAPDRAPGDQSQFMISGVQARTALPLGVARVHVASFKAAVADEGCVISTSQQRAAVQSRTGFTDERIERIIGYVWRTGELDRNSGSYTLTTGRCGDA